MDSAIGLSTMIAIGPESFRAMLACFHAMYEHFCSAPFAQNLPVLMGMLTVWNSDFFNAQTVAVLPYDQNFNRCEPWRREAVDAILLKPCPVISPTA